MKSFEDNKLKESIMKKIKVCDGASAGREVILNYYLYNYR
jgi:hypothetical protein